MFPQAATAKALLKENADMREKVEGLKARERAGEERVEMLEQQGGNSGDWLQFWIECQIKKSYTNCSNSYTVDCGLKIMARDF